MLLKIVPFLVWLNLQQRWIKSPSVKMPLSNMQQVIPHPQAKRQYCLLMLTFIFCLLMMSGLQSLWIVKLTAISMLACCSYLLYNLIKARQLYERLAQTLRSSAR